MPEVISEEPQELGSGRVWVSGSKTRPGHIHATLQIEGRDEWACTCEGFIYRNKCKHITYLRELMEDDDGFPDEEFQVIL